MLNGVRRYWDYNFYIAHIYLTSWASCARRDTRWSRFRLCVGKRTRNWTGITQEHTCLSVHFLIKYCTPTPSTGHLYSNSTVHTGSASLSRSFFFFSILLSLVILRYLIMKESLSLATHSNRSFSLGVQAVIRCLTFYLGFKKTTRLNSKSSGDNCFVICCHSPSDKQSLLLCPPPSAPLCAQCISHPRWPISRQSNQRASHQQCMKYSKSLCVFCICLGACVLTEHGFVWGL